MGTTAHKAAHALSQRMREIYAVALLLDLGREMPHFLVCQFFVVYNFFHKWYFLKNRYESLLKVADREFFCFCVPLLFDQA